MFGRLVRLFQKSPQQLMNDASRVMRREVALGQSSAMRAAAKGSRQNYKNMQTAVKTAGENARTAGKSVEEIATAKANAKEAFLGSLDDMERAAVEGLEASMEGLKKQAFNIKPQNWFQRNKIKTTMLGLGGVGLGYQALARKPGQPIEGEAPPEQLGAMHAAEDFAHQLNAMQSSQQMAANPFGQSPDGPSHMIAADSAYHQGGLGHEAALGRA